MQPRVGLGVRPSGTTTVFAVLGFSLAAFVTSLAALNVGSDETAVRVSVLGGTAILLFSAVVCLVVAARMARGGDRRVWLMAGVGMSLTAVASGVRALDVLDAAVGPGVAEGLYMAGMVVLCAGMVLALWSRRGTVGLRHLAVWGTVAALGVMGSYLGLLWMTAAERGVVPAGLGTAEVVSFAIFMTAVVAVSLTLLLGSFKIGHTEPSLPWVVFAAGMLATAAGDLMWIWQNTVTTWSPGAMGDFAHICGHVLVAVAALSAADAERAGPQERHPW